MASGTGDGKQSAKSGPSARDKRLAAALRENLRRRKAQERARATENEPVRPPADGKER